MCARNRPRLRVEAYIIAHGYTKLLKNRHLIPTAESSDPSDHAVPQDANVWAQLNIFADRYQLVV